MVQRNPEAGPPRIVRKRDGRQVPFDREALARSVRAALAATDRDEPTLARDLASVVVTYLSSRAPGGSIEAAEVAELVREVLAGAGCELAAHAYVAARASRHAARAGLRIRRCPDGDAVRDLPPGGGEPDDDGSWSKGRIVALLAAEADVPEPVAQQVAADVERGLFASGLRSVSVGLLREWVDNELELRGLKSRLGRHPFVGLPPRELREVLAAGAVGRGAEADLASRLLARYALREVYPEPVAAAHEQGFLDLENLSAGARLDALCVRPWSLPALAPAGARRERLRQLGPLLRDLAQLAGRELLLAWDGPALPADSAADLLGQAAEPAGLERAALVAFELPADCPAQSASFLAALVALSPGASRRGLRLPALRLPAGALPEDLLREAIAREAVDARVQFVAEPAVPGACATSVAVDVARVALAAGPRRVREFLDGLDRLLDLALQALAAHEALAERGSGLGRALGRSTGLPPGALPMERRIALCGVAEATVALLGDGPRGRANRLDLAAALGEKLAARLGGAPGSGRARLGLAGDASARRFGRLDLGTFPDARDLLPLSRDRGGFRYDGALVLRPGDDPGEAGLEAARLRRLLGVAEPAPVPRTTGGVDERCAFLHGFLSVTHPEPDLHPCG